MSMPSVGSSGSRKFDKVGTAVLSLIIKQISYSRIWRISRLSLLPLPNHQTNSIATTNRRPECRAE